jgi:hypothetical protein
MDDPSTALAPPSTGGALLVESALGLAQPPATPLRCRRLRRRLIAAALPELLVLLSPSTASASARISSAICASRAWRAATRWREASSRRGDQIDASKSGLGAEPQRVSDRPLVAGAETRDRRPDSE